MNRRESLSAMVGICAAAGATAEVKAIEPDPQPLLWVITIDQHLPPEALARIRASFEERWRGVEHAPVVICQPGMDIRAEVDPRAKQ